MAEQAQEVVTFRVHYEGGGHMDIDAESPDAARAAFKKRYPKILINRVKRVKGGDA